ncbi:ABC transporter substrate-binding protein [Arthrobacter monumenti]
MKRSSLTKVGAGLFASALMLTGCGGGGSNSGSEAGGGSEPVQIGISQIVEHPSLDAARKGFKQALTENGYENAEFDEQNAQGDQATATTIASQFASEGKDLVLAIATPTAQAAAQTITDIPVLITAVTAPVEAGLVDSLENPGGNVTGTSDLNPVEKQLSLVKELAPDAETVGVVYSSGEVNSEVQVKLAREAAKEMGLKLEEATVTNSSEVQQAANSLDVDAIYVPTDNAVVSALKSVVQVAEKKQIPLIVGEANSVEEGGVATYGIDYEKLGHQTGMMAIEILEGADPATMPIETLEDIQLVINTKAAERMGVEVPQELLDQADRVIKK